MTLHISDLQVSYAGLTVLTDVTLGPLENGTITGLLGPNAAGKSTLVKTIAGLKKASGGRCQVLSEGREVTGPSFATSSATPPGPTHERLTDRLRIRPRP